jgi:hypothetical protein
MHGIEVWHLVLGVVGIGLSVLGWGFAAWSRRLNDMSERLDKRLTNIESASDRRWAEIERKMDRHETRIHDLHVQVERRVTMLEARFTAHNPHAGICD